MKAAYFMEHGGPDVMQFGDVPDPVANAGEVLVDVHAASVNGADWKVRSGRYRPITHFPYVLGRDFSGVVSAVGAGASGGMSALLAAVGVMVVVCVPRALVRTKRTSETPLLVEFPTLTSARYSALVAAHRLKYAVPAPAAGVLNPISYSTDIRRSPAPETRAPSHR